GVVAVSVAKALAAAAAAFSTREVFAAFDGREVSMPAAALAAIAASGIAIAGLRIMERVLAERIGQHYAADLRLLLFDHVAHMPQRVLSRRSTGGLGLRFLGDMGAARAWVSLGIARLVSASIVLPAAVAVLLALDPAIGVAAAAPMALGIVLMLLIGARLGRLHRRIRSRRNDLATGVAERLAHAPVLRGMGRLRQERRMLRRRSDRLARAAVARARASAAMTAVPDMILGLSGAAILLTALATGAGVATAAGALAALGLAVQPMRELAGVADRHRAWLAARARCLDLLGAPRLEPGRAPTRRRRCMPVLQLRKVSIGPLRDLDATLAKGRRAALIGPNGAGKSTLLNLAAGLDRPDAGRVRVAGQDPVPVEDRAGGRQPLLIGARTPVLAGSLRRALTLGIAPRRDDGAVEAMAERFGLAPVIARLGGLDGRVSDGGRNLSAGELRRIALVRAALSTSRLLLLDEPDDALDGDAAALIATLFAATDAAVLMVTHDEAIAALADETWCLANGRLRIAEIPAAAA
ncbi:MAG: ATP-binding cassette domain-containing protein, partial [Pseudomonadota bacterium]